MFYYIRQYPFSLIVVGLVVYFSFFTPPSIDLPPFPYFDKVAHFCMYGGLTGMLWVEFLWNHRREALNLKRGLVGGTLIPILFGGLVEVLQATLTTTRSGDFRDFLSNSAGVLIATVIAWYIIRPWLQKRFKNR